MALLSLPSPRDISARDSSVETKRPQLNAAVFVLKWNEL